MSEPAPRPAPPLRPVSRVPSNTPPWLLPLGAAALLIVLLGLSFLAGRQSISADVPTMRRELAALSERSKALTRDNERLGTQVAELEMTRRVDREAYGQIERTLGDLQSKLSRQGDDLAFYRSIVSPSDGVQGLRIQRLDIERLEEARKFVLRLTLIQAMRHETLVSGLAEVVVHGVENDRPARYSVGQLLGRPRAQLPFSFRYFQTVEQEVSLPEGFQPFEAEVQVRSSKLRFPLQQNFPWKPT